MGMDDNGTALTGYYDILFYYCSPERAASDNLHLFMACALHTQDIYILVHQSGHDKPYPIIIVSMAFIFNCLNGFVNGYGLFRYVVYSFSWIMRWQFVAGFLIFIAGFIINKTADEKLRKMRKNSPDEYVIPQGWLFNFISSPHYFGEVAEWTGWAVLTWSTPGLAFALFTFANLFPRAWASHNWYRENFSEYPKNRKAIIPFLI